jgi:hypothetical protein
MNFQVDLKKEIVSSSGLSAESMKFDLGSQIVKISVQGEGKICSDSDCSSYPESPQLTVG